MPPLGGGLMQLIAYGAQDVYLTGNSQQTYFKVVYRRHTNFAIEGVFNDDREYFEKDHLKLLKHVKNLEDFKYVMSNECLKHVDDLGNNYYLIMCNLGIIEILKYLEEDCEFDPNVKNDNMERAYDLAIKNMDIKLMEYLEKNDKYTGLTLFELDKTEECEEICIICKEAVEKDDIYCKCEFNHVIHKKCCLMNEQIKNRLPVCMDVTAYTTNDHVVECLCCKNNLIKKSFKCK